MHFKRLFYAAGAAVLSRCLLFPAPALADVKGSMFLSWEYDDPSRNDDKWLYMPAMKKERRISGASRNEYFMGSDFIHMGWLIAAGVLAAFAAECFVTPVLGYKLRTFGPEQGR